MDENASGVINLEDFNQFLKNIDAVNNFSGDELNAIIYEAGNIEGSISVSKIVQLMWVLGIKYWTKLCREHTEKFNKKYRTVRMYR